ncbi:hypothetical protein VTO42DRAFT_7734 [Malbranchea cinnamomea]
MHNYYALLYNRVVYETLSDCVGKSQSCLFARSTAPEGQAYPVHWGGDCESTYEAMAESLRGGLSLMPSGYAFWASDIGEFEGTSPQTLYKRWVQFGLLSSHSRLHGSSSFRVPWIYGEDCSDVLRDCVKRIIFLTPYILQEALLGHKQGTPLMKPLLEFPDDLNTYAVDTEYMFGGDLLVAPVFSEEGEVTFYVPRDEREENGGKWVSGFDHTKTYEGGKWCTEAHGFATLPLLIRPGAAIFVNSELKSPMDDPFEGLEVLVNRTVEVDTVLTLVNPERMHKVLQEVPFELKPEERDSFRMSHLISLLDGHKDQTSAKIGQAFCCGPLHLSEMYTALDHAKLERTASQN